MSRALLVLLAGCSLEPGGKGTDPEGAGGGGGDGVPSVSLVAPVDGEVFAESAGVSVGIFASDPDAPVEDLAVTWTSSGDGDVAGPASVAVDGSATGTLSLSPGEHQLTVSVEDGDGHTADDVATITVDGTPLEPTVTISPVEPVTQDDLLAGVLDVDLDPEGETVSFRYAWARDGADAGLTADVVSAADTARGEVWTVRVWASDGRQEGPSGIASVTVGPSCDQDGDGALDADPECGGDDCDDLDAGAFPGNTEVWYDGVDGDCDGADDADADGDGSPLGEDCDDSDATAAPDALEDCFDGVDNDCDGTVDTCVEAAASAAAIIASDRGESMATGVPAGDVDGDGVEDVWVGGSSADGATTASGAAYLHLGPLSGTLVASSGVAGVVGADRSDAVGRVIAPAGDLDGDGYDDVWHGASGAGAPCRDWSTDDCNQGEAWLFLGPLTGTLGEADAEHVLIGEGSIDYAASALVPLDDCDGDGVPDLAVVGRGYTGGRTSFVGALWLVSGPVTAITELADADATIEGDAVGARFGWLHGATNAGDTDGDGLDEVWLGAHYAGYDGVSASTAKGMAYLIRGIPSATRASSAADFRVEGDLGGDWLGYGVLGPGDLNDDGYDDLVVSAVHAGAAGEVYVIHGPASVSGTAAGVASARLQSTAALGSPGLGLAAAGDVNGDGDADLWVGLAYAGSDLEGAAVLVAGPLSGTLSLGSAAIELQGTDRLDQVGDRMSSGDIDGDGLMDLIVAGRGADPLGAGSYPGAVFIWPGSDL